MWRIENKEGWNWEEGDQIVVDGYIRPERRVL